MRDGMRQSMVQQMMQNGGDQSMVSDMEAEIDAMTQQLERKMHLISQRKSGGDRCVPLSAAAAGAASGSAPQCRAGGAHSSPPPLCSLPPLL